MSEGLTGGGERDLSRPIVIVGALPPPVSGYSLITGKVLEVARGYRKVIVYDISPGRPRRGLAYHLTRLLRVLLAVVRLFPARLDRARELYIATESRAGLLYTIALSLVARMIGYRIFLHHHVYRYISRKSRLMALLVGATRTRATHIFLCSCMEADFTSLYGPSLSTFRLANAAFIEIPQKYERNIRQEGEPLTVGHLSNLTREKGLYEFLALVKKSAAEGLPARFVLAGPVANQEDMEAIRTVEIDFSKIFEYRGPIYAAEKDRFYRDIDAFVFPSSYDNEAQPLVLFEAMSYGCPVIAFERGCIKEQIAGSGIAIGVHENFVDAALSTLKGWQNDRRGLFLLQRKAAASLADENARAKRSAQRLLGVARDARSARQLRTGAQVLYDALRWSGGLVLEGLLGSPYLSDAYASLMTQAARAASRPHAFAVPVLQVLLARQFPDAYRRRGVAFIHIPKNAGTSINHALYGRSFGHMSASLLREIDPHAYGEVESFAVLRDPIEHAVSAYFHIRSGGGSEVRLHPRWARRLGKIDSFESYLVYLEENRQRLTRLTFVMRPQYHFICDASGRVLVNRLFVLGHDDEALSSFIAERGMFALPHRNWTSHEFLEVTKSQRGRLRDLYADDFKLIEEQLSARALRAKQESGGTT